MTKLQTKAEERLIQDYFDDLMKACDRKVSDEGKVRIQKAFEFANTRKGYWRISNSPILSLTLKKDTLKKLGYIFFSDYYKQVRVN